MFIHGGSGTAGADEEATGLSRFGKSVRTFLIKFWIWLVAINLFGFGIQGSQVVIFRIMYMVLFLIFTIVFQVLTHYYL
jgi:hypothetical protein